MLVLEEVAFIFGHEQTNLNQVCYFVFCCIFLIPNLLIKHLDIAHMRLCSGYLL